MTEITQYTITVGNNTNVTAATQNLTAEQQKALQELQKMVPGDISISADGVVSITSQKGLALFNNFCQQNGIQDSSTNRLMELHAPEGTTLPLEGLKSASAFCASFGGGQTDPSKMSFTELMTLMLMMSYASEEERRRVLSEVKSTQMQIAMEVAVATWETSREAAEKTYSAEVMQAWGTIASGIASGAMAIGSAAFSLKTSPKQGKLADNNKKLENSKLLQNQADLQTELKLPDTKPETIQAKQTEVKQQIQRKEAQIQQKEAQIEPKKAQIEQKQKAIDEANEKGDITQKKQLEAEKIGLENELRDLKGLNTDKIADKQAQIEQKQKAIDEADETGDLTQKKQLEAEKIGLENELDALKRPTQLKDEVKGLKVQEAKLDELTKIGKKIEEKGLTPEDRLGDGEIKLLKYGNKKLEAEISELSAKSGAISSLSQSVSSVLKGAFDLQAAGFKREAAFLEAESRLLDTFRGVLQSQIQGVDSSINSATQNMQKIAGSLKQVLDETYNILTSIARNI
ncbi:MAG: hypothetical protein LBI47_01095 [Puniceicoccales bacterium]|jgi:hypothetical protein|nr:hypothetical protein [Puniceicoccales bacterium]